MHHLTITRYVDASRAYRCLATVASGTPSDTSKSESMLDNRPSWGAVTTCTRCDIDAGCLNHEECSPRLVSHRISKIIKPNTHCNTRKEGMQCVGKEHLSVAWNQQKTWPRSIIDASGPHYICKMMPESHN
jgi:hypothetical protein